MPSIDIFNFSGGKNVRDSQILAQPIEAVSTGTTNVWARGGPLSKFPGYALESILSVTGNNRMKSATATAGNNLYFEPRDNLGLPIIARAYIADVSGQSTKAEVGWRLTTGSDPFTWSPTATPRFVFNYITGTIATNSGSISATGTGTAWSSNINAGDVYVRNLSSNHRIAVASVEDDTHLTLASTANATESGVVYNILMHMNSQCMGWASFAGYLINANASGNMQLQDVTGGSAAQRVTAAPIAPFIQVHKSYLFASRSTTAQSRVYWSALNDPTTWPATNFIDVAKDRGVVAGMKTIGNELIVFKTNSMFKILGETFDPANPTYQVQEISVPHSFRFNSYGSIAEVRGRLVFFAGGAVYEYLPGTYAINLISDRISDDFGNQYQDIASVTAAADCRVFGISYRDLYLLKGIDHSSRTPRLSLHVLDGNGAWWKATDSTASTVTASPMTGQTPFVNYSLDNSSEPSMFAISYGNPVGLYRFNIKYPLATSNDQVIEPDDGSTARAISSVWLSKEFNIDYGLFKNLIVYVKKQSSGTLTASYSVDQGTFVSNSIDMSAGRGNMIRAVIPINQKGSTIQVRFVQDTANVDMEIYGARVIYEQILEDYKR